MIEKKTNNIKRTKSKTPRLWYLTVKNFKTMIRDKPQIAWLIFYPLFFIFIFGVVFGGSSSSQKFDVVIFNDDDSLNNMFSDQLIDVLKSKDMEETLTILDDYDKKSDAEYDLKYQKFDAIIMIKANFSYNIYYNETAEVDVTTIPDQVVEGVINSILKDIINEITMKVNNVKSADVDSEQIENSVQLKNIDYAAGGFIIAGTLVIVSQLANHFIEEKDHKTLSRLTTTPVARRDIVVSALISQLVVAALQTILMLFLATVVLGVYVHPNANLFMLFLIPMLFSFTCLGIGLILASFLKSESSSSLIWFVILPLQFLGGVFSYGVDIPVGEFIPTTYAVHAMRLIMLSGLSSWDAIGTDILVLIGTGIASTLLGILLFERKTAVI